MQKYYSNLNISNLKLFHFKVFLLAFCYLNIEICCIIMNIIYIILNQLRIKVSVFQYLNRFYVIEESFLIAHIKNIELDKNNESMSIKICLMYKICRYNIPYLHFKLLRIVSRYFGIRMISFLNSNLCSSISSFVN